MVTGCYAFISTAHLQDILVLTLEATEICEPEAAASLRQEISSAFRADGRRHVIVDMHNVEFISTVGYGPLIGLRQQLAADGGKVVLCGLSSFVREVFTTSHMLIDAQRPAAMFYCADSLDQAVELLQRLN